jgi:hypothetical protein
MVRKEDVKAGAGRGNRTPKTRRSADFESAAYSVIIIVNKKVTAHIVSVASPALLAKPADEVEIEPG